MAYALIANTGAGCAAGAFTTVTTPAINTFGADLIVAAVSYFPNGAGSVALTDSKGNTLQTLTLRQSTNGRCRIYYLQNPIVGSGHTFQFSHPTLNIFPSITVSAWSGSAVSPFDQENGAGSGSSGSTISPGSVTPTQDNELVIAALEHDANSSGAVSINGGFTITNAVSHDGNHEGGAMAYLIQTTAAAANPQWNITNNASDRVAAIATFKAAAVAGGQPTMRRWGGVPHMGTSKLRNGGIGGPWGRDSRSGLIVPRRFAA
jgi:hypothetical protein